MVIEFPTVGPGGAPPTEEGAAEDGAAFASIVDGLLAEESALPDEGDAERDHDNETAPSDVAAFLFALPSVGSVPAVPGGGPNDPAAGSSQNGLFATFAAIAGAAGNQARGSHPSAGPAPGGVVSPAGTELPGVWLASSETVPSTPTGPPAAGQIGTNTSGAQGVPGAESASDQSLFPLPSGSPTEAFGVEDQPQAQTAASTASATQPVSEALTASGDALEGDHTARRSARGDAERPWTSPNDEAQAHSHAVQRVAAFAELGPDLGSSGGDGSRDGGSSGSLQAGVPGMSASATHAATCGTLLSASAGQAAPADDVVLPQLVRAMRLQVAGGVGEARIQLDPEHLGAVTVNLRVEGGVVSAVVTAEQAGVRQWIESHEASLRQALAEQGLLLDRLHVERDGRPPGEGPSQGQDGTPRRRTPRRDTATFELLA